MASQTVVIAFDFEPSLTPNELRAFLERMPLVCRLVTVCDHNWQEQPGEPACDVCSSCGEVRY
jgi:hypothetical protein